METFGLFHWKSTLVLQTTSGSIEIHLRTLGGIEDEQRTDAALAASMKARAELEDKASQLHINHISPLLGLDKNGLKEVVLQLQRGLFVRESRWRVEPLGDPDPPEESISPDGFTVLSKPDLNKALDWKEKQNSLRGELQERRDEWVDERIEALEKELGKSKKADLQKRATDLHKSAITERAYNREWDWQTVLKGSFKDEKCTKPFFGTVQEVRNLPTSKFLQIATAYLELDVFSRNPETLKNSS